MNFQFHPRQVTQVNNHRINNKFNDWLINK